MSKLPDEQAVARALGYLAETDAEEANARALVKALDETRKVVEAIEFGEAQGSAAERQQKAKASQAYRDHIEKMQNAIADHALLQNRRNRAVLTVEVWRSLNASRRNGNM